MSDKSLFNAFMDVATTLGMSIGAGLAIATLLNLVSTELERRADAAAVVPIVADHNHDEKARFTQFMASHYPPATPAARLRHDLEASGFACTTQAQALSCRKTRGHRFNTQQRWRVDATLSGETQAVASIAADVFTLGPNAR